MSPGVRSRIWDRYASAPVRDQPRERPAPARRRAPKRPRRHAWKRPRRPSPARSRTGPRRWRRRLLAGGLAVVSAGVLAFVLTDGEALEDTIGIDLEDVFLEVTLPLRHEDIIRQQAAEKRVPADLIAAVIYAESRFRDQTSHAGARGLMQITPQTAEVIEKLSGGSTFSQEDLADPDINIRYGTFYLRHLIQKFDGSKLAAVAAYNAGETVVAKWGGAKLKPGDIRFKETRGFVDDVFDKRKEYRKHYSDELGL